MWKFKSCPKCDGDLYVDWDMNGWFVECLQCGYMSDLDTVLKARKEHAEKETKFAHAAPKTPLPDNHLF